MAALLCNGRRGKVGVKMFENSMRLEFLAISRNESFARVAVGSFFTQLNPTLEELADVKTAISEAVTNSIVHGYKNKGGTIVIECVILNDTMAVTVEDYGVGIADVDEAKQPFFTTMPGDERSGMGFTVMEAFMDGLEIKSRLGEGTTVCMLKKVAGSEQAEHTEKAEQLRQDNAG